MKIKNSLILAPVLLFLLIPVIIAESDSQANGSSVQNAVPKIAFTSKRNGNFEIYTVNEDGTDLKRLTNTRVDESAPQWSPDGSKLLYLAQKGGKHEIWSMNSEGGGEVKLAADCIANNLPLWSPDGSKIVFLAKYKSRKAVFVVNSDGTNPLRLTENNTEGSAPSWSPDGSKVLYLQRFKDDTNIYAINPDGTERKMLTKNKGTNIMTPSWSPDGSKVAYINLKFSFIGGIDYTICIMNADGSNPLDIAKASKKLPDIDFQDDLCWSPDGSAIAFTKVAKIYPHASDSGKTTFTFDYGTYFVKATGNDLDNQLAITGPDRARPSWSPDSTKLAYLSYSKLKIFTLKGESEAVIPVAAAIPLSPLRWSPDGAKIIFAAKNSSFSKSALFLVKLDGTVTKLSEAADYDPVWAPAGKAE